MTHKNHFHTIFSPFETKDNKGKLRIKVVKDTFYLIIPRTRTKTLQPKDPFTCFIPHQTKEEGKNNKKTFSTTFISN